jgi:hypothetical protein
VADTLPQVPDLMATLPPVPPGADRDTVDSWDAGSMQGYMDAQDRQIAWACAHLAARYQEQGRPHLDVMLALSGAEHRSPTPEDRAFHAARLDAYAAAYGLSGWYRGTDGHGRPYVQVNRLRTAQDGDAGRYFTHHADEGCHGADGAYWVVDRDTGRTAFRARSSKEAAAWITENGGDTL